MSCLTTEINFDQESWAHFETDRGGVVELFLIAGYSYIALPLLRHSSQVLPSQMWNIVCFHPEVVLNGKVPFLGSEVKNERLQVLLFCYLDCFEFSLC
jgi:hypothetical protein